MRSTCCVGCSLVERAASVNTSEIHNRSFPHAVGRESPLIEQTSAEATDSPGNKDGSSLIRTRGKFMAQPSGQDRDDVPTRACPGPPGVTSEPPFLWPLVSGACPAELLGPSPAPAPRRGLDAVSPTRRQARSEGLLEIGGITVGHQFGAFEEAFGISHWTLPFPNVVPKGSRRSEHLGTQNGASSYSKPPACCNPPFGTGATVRASREPWLRAYGRHCEVSLSCCGRHCEHRLEPE
jgi:hypothetical protein